MREIKFRGQRVDNGKWVYGDLIHGVNHKQGKTYILPIRGGVMSLSDGCDPLDGYEVIPESVGQYTGLKDKDGREIYEGDVYHHGDKKITYTVVWHGTGFIGKQNGSSSYAGIEHWIKNIQVIGNIYENPELLNKSPIKISNIMYTESHDPQQDADVFNDSNKVGFASSEQELQADQLKTKPLTFGEKLVGLTFNPSNDDKVSRVKKLFADAADILYDDHKGEGATDLYDQLYHHAIGEILNAQMNAVKVLTLKY